MTDHDPLRTIIPKNGTRPRPIGKYGSVREASRKLGITRQEVKRLLAPKPKDHHAWQR